MNFIKFWVSLFGPISFNFGGGGGSPTTQSTGTSYNTNIPEYAQPYVETMLGATQKQLFNMDGNDITGFKPYQPYSTNADDYVAGFSPLQQQAMQATGQLGVPNQYGQATNMTRQAGMGSLGLAGQMAGAGQNYAQQATDPMATQAYMSPYMQNVVDYQKSQALRDYGIGAGMRKAQSVGQGAFGGNRQALMESEAQRALSSQLGGIDAQGAQQAFQNAQQAQQYGANLGLQGQQGAMQGLGQYGQMAGQLGQLGGQQLAAQQGIIQSQYGMGQQQQGMEQQKINQAMQDWANTQQYPLMQLGVMSNMLRGLPMQASTTNQYQAAPNALTQGIGAAGAGASLYNALKGASGGLPSEFKGSKGIKSYYEGDVVEGTKSDLYDLPLSELEKQSKNSPSPTIKRLANSILKERTGKAGGGIIAFANPSEENNQSVVKEDRRPTAFQEDLDNLNPKPAIEKAVQGVRNVTDEYVAQPINSIKRYFNEPRAKIDASQTDPAPVAAAPTEAVPAKAAEAVPAKATAPAAASVENKGVGIKPNTSIVPDIGGIKGPTNLPAGLEAPADDPYAKMSIEEVAAKREAYLGPDVRKEERAGLMAERANAKDEARRAQSLRMAEFFAAWGSTPGSTIVAGLKALQEKVPSIVTDAREEAKIRRAINKDIAGLDKADRLEKAGNWDAAAKLKSDLGKGGRDTYGKQLDFMSARMSDASRERAAITTASAKSNSDSFTKLVAQQTAKQTLINNIYKNNEALVRQANLPDSVPDAKKLKKEAQDKLDELTREPRRQLEQISRLVDSYNQIQNLTETGSIRNSNIPDTVTSGGKTYSRSDYPKMTDTQWSQYVEAAKKAPGAK